MKFDNFITNQEFHKHQSDHCVYFKKIGNEDYVIMLLYMDEMFVAGKTMQDIITIKKKLANYFAMKDLGEAKQILI